MGVILMLQSRLDESMLSIDRIGIFIAKIKSSTPVLTPKLFLSLRKLLEVE